MGIKVDIKWDYRGTSGMDYQKVEPPVVLFFSCFIVKRLELGLGMGMGNGKWEWYPQSQEMTV